MLPGAGCDTAQETALRLAIYAAAPYEIDKKNPNRAEKGAAKVRPCVGSLSLLG